MKEEQFLKHLKWIWLGMVLGGILASLLFTLPVHAGAIPEQIESSVSVPGTQSNPYWVTPLNSFEQDDWTVIGTNFSFGLNAPYLAGKQAGDYILLVDDAGTVALPYRAMNEARLTSIDALSHTVTFVMVSQDYVVFDTRVTHPVCLEMNCTLGG